MPKTLLIMRHAKSSWSDSKLSDHQRPLNKRGMRDAPAMARFIESEQLVPDLIMSSSANRAKSTAQLFCENCPGVRDGVVITDEFYHAPADVYLEHAAEFSDDVSTAMVVGHNPGMEHLVAMLAGEYESMPTAAIAHVVFATDSWQDISIDNAQVRTVWRPKEI